MPASMPRRWMKASIALLRPLALLLMMFILVRDGLGENPVVDQIEIAAHAPQVADGGSHCSFERPVVLDNDVGADPDLPIGMCEFNCSPWCLEASRGSGGHAGQRRRDLRDDPSFRQPGFEAHIVDLPRSKEA